MTPAPAPDNLPTRERVEQMRDECVATVSAIKMYGAFNASRSLDIDDERDLAAILSAYLRLTQENEWREIESAPKGGGAAMVTDPAWVEPPEILLLFPPSKKAAAAQAVGVWDWYYAPDGGGYAGCSAWILPASGDLLAMYYGEPTHWKPLSPPSENSTGGSKP